MLFSIVTINKNNLSGLQTTWKSLLSQSFIFWQWVVIDGASTDGAAEWLSTLEDERICWLSEQDNGIYDAMNKGIDLARGAYVHFLNSGDRFAENTVLEKISQHPLVLAQSAKFLYGDTLECLPSGYIYYKKARRYQGYVKGMFTSHQSMLFQAGLFASGIKYDTRWKLSADYGLVSKILKSVSNEDVLYFNFPIAKFSIGGAHFSQRTLGIVESSQIHAEILGIPWAKRSLILVSQLLWHGIKLLFPWKLHLFVRKIFFRKEIIG